MAWSIVGSGSFTSEDETREVLELAKTTPNVSAIMLDDFFTGKADGKLAFLTVDKLRSIRQEIQAHDQPLDILVTLYCSFLDFPLDDYLELIAVVPLWGGEEDLTRIDHTFSSGKELLPQTRLMLGCYMFDFGKKEPMDVDFMKWQSELGLRWLHERHIKGMIFLSNTVTDFDFAAVE